MVSHGARKLYFKKSLKGKGPVAKKDVAKTEKKEEKKARHPRFYEPQRAKGKLHLRPTRLFSKHRRHRLRKSITPGTVLILLAGSHKGKRVIFLKQLPKTGMLLVTGPFKYNGCPLRRVHPRLVIATQTKLDIKSVKLPETVNDEFFKRATTPKEKKTTAQKELFAQEKDAYKLSDVRKAAQKEVDSQIVKLIKERKDPFLIGYLTAKFGLFRKDYPHSMKF